MKDILEIISEKLINGESKEIEKLTYVWRIGSSKDNGKKYKNIKALS